MGGKPAKLYWYGKVLLESFQTFLEGQASSSSFFHLLVQEDDGFTLMPLHFVLTCQVHLFFKQGEATFTSITQGSHFGILIDKGDSLLLVVSDDIIIIIVVIF